MSCTFKSEILIYLVLANNYKYMDITSLKEIIIADYISKIQVISKEELVNELIELKCHYLDSCSESEIIKNQHDN
jgi:hypothetical protein